MLLWACAAALSAVPVHAEALSECAQAAHLASKLGANRVPSLMLHEKRRQLIRGYAAEVFLFGNYRENLICEKFLPVQKYDRVLIQRTCYLLRQIDATISNAKDRGYRRWTFHNTNNISNKCGKTLNHVHAATKFNRPMIRCVNITAITPCRFANGFVNRPITIEGATPIRSHEMVRSCPWGRGMGFFGADAKGNKIRLHSHRTDTELAYVACPVPLCMYGKFSDRCSGFESALKFWKVTPINRRQADTQNVASRRYAAIGCNESKPICFLLCVDVGEIPFVKRVNTLTRTSIANRNTSPSQPVKTAARRGADKSRCLDGSHALLISVKHDLLFTFSQIGSFCHVPILPTGSA